MVADMEEPTPDPQPPDAAAFQLAEQVVALDRKLSRAMAAGRGIALTSEQLDVLIAIGAIDQLSAAKAAALKEIGKWRRSQAGVYQRGRVLARSRTGRKRKGPSRRAGTSGGMTAAVDTSGARARARTMFV